MTTRPGNEFSRSDLFPAFVLAALTFAVYAQTLGFEFVDIDDPFHVTANPHVQRGIDALSLHWAWTVWHAGYWIPLTWMSHMLDVELYGLSAGGHHSTNVFLHVANTLLLFALLRGLTGARGRYASALAAALFALHPLRVESVAWVTERKDVLSSFFGLLSIAAYVHYVSRRRIAAYGAALLALALSLAAKPMLVTLPCLFLLLDYWPLERWNSRDAWRLCAEKIPFVAVVAPFCAVTWVAQAAASKTGDLALLGDVHIPLALRCVNAMTSYVRYLGKTLWPTELSVVYPHPYRPGGVPWETGEIAMAFALLLSLTALVIWARRRRYLVVGWLWFLGTLVPVIGLVQSGEQAMADRFTYMPSIGLCIAVAWGTLEITRLPLLRRSSVRRSLFACVLLVLATLAATSFSQVGHWQNSDTLYRKSLTSIPRNPLMNTYYGLWLQREGRLAEAAEQHRAAAEDDDYAAVGYTNLASLHTAMGEPERAIEYYREALRIESGLGRAHLRLGRLLRASGQAELAITHFRAAARSMPQASAPLVALARTLASSSDPKVRDPERAVAVAEDAVALSGGGEAVSLDTLALAAAAAGQHDLAFRTQRRAIEHASGAPPNELARMKERLERYRSAALRSESAPGSIRR